MTAWLWIAAFVVAVGAYLFMTPAQSVVFSVVAAAVIVAGTLA